MKLTLHGYSTALFSTWYFIEELGVLFDAGDGLTAHLLGKSGKIKHAFISHADRDHITGLLQYNQLFAHLTPQIYYPKDAGSFKYLQTFFKSFDPHQKEAVWNDLEDKDEIKVKQNIKVKVFENKHIHVNGKLKSLSYGIYEEKYKLKSDFLKLSAHEIKQLKHEKGEDYIREKVRKNILTYSGDTPIYNPSVYDNCGVLIHEATFLKQEETNNKANKNKHSALEGVMKMVSDIKIETLVLGHFFTRYNQYAIDTEIKRLIRVYNIKIPVYRVHVGKAAYDVLNGSPLN